jgi:hypothetical protein
VAQIQEVKSSGSGSYRLWHKDQEIFFHRNSVNVSKKKLTQDQMWVVFFEKFGTPHRITVSTTCFINSMPLLLFGGAVVVKHMERKVVVDDWMEVAMAAQVGVLLRQLREQLIGTDGLLHKLFINYDGYKSTTKSNAEMINRIVDILSSSTR